MNFTERKYKSFEAAQQHRNCAALLREMYNRMLEGGSFQEHIEIYNQQLAWMEEEKIDNFTNEHVADLYHKHLRQASQNLKEHNLLPRITHSDRDYAEKSWPIAIYLDNLRSAHNVGSIVRTVEGLSLGSLFFSEKTPYIDHPQVQKAAMGSAEWVVCSKTEEFSSLPQPIIALETSPEATPLYEFLFPRSFTLVIGNEEYGCREQSLKQANFYISIPMRGRKNSFNVANAFSMAAYEIARQRSRQKDI